MRDGRCANMLDQDALTDMQEPCFYHWRRFQEDPQALFGRPDWAQHARAAMQLANMLGEFIHPNDIAAFVQAAWNNQRATVPSLPLPSLE